MKKIPLVLSFLALLAVACVDKSNTADLNSDETVDKEVILAEEQAADNMEAASAEIEETSKELDELLNEI